MVRQGEVRVGVAWRAWHGRVRWGAVGQGEARLVWLEVARQAKARYGRLGMARRGLARRGAARQAR